eukprot:2878913-Pyramimonas_sp.AAC.1
MDRILKELPVLRKVRPLVYPLIYPLVCCYNMFYCLLHGTRRHLHPDGPHPKRASCPPEGAFI